MAKPKKGALHQVLVPMVDSTDFASVESAITASDFNSGATVKFYGLNTGGSAATTSGTVSKTASLVRSGVFRVTLKTTENNYDMMMLRVNKTGCAEQIMVWSNVDNDDSDMMSALTVIQSMASDAASAAVQANSRVLLNQSRISDVQSYLVAMSASISDVQSAVAATELDASDLSDIASAVWAAKYTAHSAASSFGSLFSDVYSRVVLVQSAASDAASAAVQANSRVLLNQSRISDVQSYLVAMSDALSDAHSDLGSKIGAITASVSASDISDIASAVRAILVSDLSDIHSAATAGASRALINQSRISDVQSFLSDFQSDLISHIDTTGVGLNASTMSDLRSAIGAGPAATITASDISDIASAVWAAKYTAHSAASSFGSLVSDIYSRIVLNQSRISDVQSYLVAMSDALSDAHSDLGSKIGAITASVSASDISDIASAVRAILASDLSDIHSAATAGASRALINQSRISDVASYLVALSDAISNIDSHVVQIKSNVSDVESQIDAGVPLDASTMSDLRSAVAATELDVSDLSDIASAVWAAKYTAHSAASSFGSLFSDVYSRAVLIQSAASDAASAAQQANSRVLLNQSRISDVASYLVAISGAISDIESQIDAGVEVGASSLSDLRSAIAATELDASDLSDIASAVWARTGADPTTVPAAAGTMAAKLDWLTAMSRNKLTQTATVQSLRNDADAADIASAAVSDDGTTFTRGEFA